MQQQPFHSDDGILSGHRVPYTAKELAKFGAVVTLVPAMNVFQTPATLPLSLLRLPKSTKDELKHRSILRIIVQLKPSYTRSYFSFPLRTRAPASAGESRLYFFFRNIFHILLSLKSLLSILRGSFL